MAPNAADVNELVERVRGHVYARRIRGKDFFKDFDTLRTGRVTKTQFLRTLNVMGIKLMENEGDALAEHFTEEGPHIHPPQDVNYARFLEVIDECFGVIPRLEADPVYVVPRPGESVPPPFVAGEVEDEAHLDHVLHRVAMLAKTRGVVLKYCFQDYERAHGASLTVPRRCGKITVENFRRSFPFTKDMAEKDILVLLDHYCTANGDINIQALHDDVTEHTSTAQPTFPKSELILRPDHAEWNQHDMSAVERVQARVVERRVRLMEHFQDWDPLRKGYCKLGQLKTVFTLLKIDISQADFDQLASLYSRDDGQFCYAAFCSEVDQAFTVNGLEKAPLYTVEQHDWRTTLPARRSRIKLSPEQEDAIRLIEDQIRARTSTRRILLRTAFQDYDPVKRKHVTRGQFGRVMNTLGFQLDESAIDLLCLVYCDLGNHFEFNYLAFCQSCDAPTEDDVLAKTQQESAFQGKLPSQYFNARNRICKIDSMY